MWLRASPKLLALKKVSKMPFLRCRTLSANCMPLIAAAALLFGMASAAGQSNPELSYLPPGDILPANVRGIDSRAVVSDDWTFPMQVGSVTGWHAYIGTQLSQYHGLKWSNDPRLFHYPSRDNQCEPRHWTVTGCPSGKGHQGVDIRANDNSNDKWKVVAVEDGVVTNVTSNTTVSVRHGTRTVRYLHMSAASIRDAGIKNGSIVHKGQILGRVSNIMEGTPSTSYHLHLDAYTGTAAEGNFYHVYPSLIAAYRRAWGLSGNVENGMLKPDPVRELPTASSPLPAHPDRPISQPVCQNAPLSSPIAGVDRNSFVSLWQHNCSIMGMVAHDDTGERQFVYFQPKQSLAGVVASEPILFAGKSEAGTITGLAKVYSAKCGVASFAVTGTVSQASENPVIVLRGKRPQRDSESCSVISTTDEILEFTFLEKVSPDVVISDSNPMPLAQRVTLSEKTRNFLAITFYPGATGKIQILPYFQNFPGYVSSGQDKDKKGGLIPTLSSDEGGVAISWVWLNKRALYTNGLLITPRTIAYSMAGIDPQSCDSELNPTPLAITAAGSQEAARRQCDAVSAYLGGYIGFAGGRNFAAEYFSRSVKLDEALDMNNPVIAWNWMRTMYSHESGRPVVIDRDTFNRGVYFGKDYIASFYEGSTSSIRPVAFYSDPCNFDQPACKIPGQGNPPLGPGQKPTSQDAVLVALREQVTILAAENKKLQALLGQLAAGRNGGGSKKASTQRRPLY